MRNHFFIKLVAWGILLLSLFSFGLIIQDTLMISQLFSLNGDYILRYVLGNMIACLLYFIASIAVLKRQHWGRVAILLLTILLIPNWLILFLLLIAHSENESIVILGALACFIFPLWALFNQHANDYFHLPPRPEK